MDERSSGVEAMMILNLNRRGLLAATGMAAAAALAGCTVSAPRNTTADDPPNTTDEPPVDDPMNSLPEGSPSSTNERMAELVGGNAGFALDLREQLTTADDVGNVFVSPYSISMALAMTYGGASGEAETAMRETLCFSLGEETHPAFGKLQAALDTRATIDVPGSSNLAIHPTADKSEKKSLQFMTSGMMVTHQSFAKLLVNLEVVDSCRTTRA